MLPPVAWLTVSLPERRLSSPRPFALRFGRAGSSRRGCSVTFERAGPDFAARSSGDAWGAAARIAAASASRFLASSASAFALERCSRSRISRSLVSASSRRRLRSASRSRSSLTLRAASSVSRAFAACTAFKRRSISTSEIPAGRRAGSPPRTVPGAAGFAAPGFGTTTRLRLVSTTTFFVRPWLKLCFTLPARGPPRKPNVFLPSSLIKLYRPFRGQTPCAT